MEEVWIVTHFGCNNNRSALWVPQTYLFTSKELAYKKYNELRPDPNDKSTPAWITVDGDGLGEICVQEGANVDHGYKGPFGTKIRKEVVSTEHTFADEEEEEDERKGLSSGEEEEGEIFEPREEATE